MWAGKHALERKKDQCRHHTTDGLDEHPRLNGSADDPVDVRSDIPRKHDAAETTIQTESPESCVSPSPELSELTTAARGPMPLETSLSRARTPPRHRQIASAAQRPFQRSHPEIVKAIRSFKKPHFSPSAPSEQKLEMSPIHSPTGGREKRLVGLHPGHFVAAIGKATGLRKPSRSYDRTPKNQLSLLSSSVVSPTSPTSLVCCQTGLVVSRHTIS